MLDPTAIIGVIGTLLGALVGAMVSERYARLRTIEQKRDAEAYAIKQKRDAEAHLILQKRDSDLRAFWLPLDAQLSTSGDAFREQTVMRERLLALLLQRGAIRKASLAEGLDAALQRSHPIMNDDEKALHGFIRAITFGWMRNANQRMVDLLDSYPELSGTVPEVHVLSNHLKFWLAKAAQFQHDDSVCLIYVGTRDGHPFPKNAESAIHKEALKLSRRP